MSTMCSKKRATGSADYLRDNQISVVQRCDIELNEDFSLADLWDLGFVKFEAIKSLVIAGHNPLLCVDGCHIDVLVVVVLCMRKKSNVYGVV